jgi:D-arabinose 1-dehydrogenase-like Zn-dependent alcohol dehydrogenase
MGHEIAGTIAQVGREVTHVAPGERVGVYWMFGCCGRMRCAAAPC